MPTMDFTDVEQVFLGGDEIQEVYCMGDLVWQKKKGEKIVTNLRISKPYANNDNAYTYYFGEPLSNKEIKAVHSFIYNGKEYINNLNFSSYITGSYINPRGRERVYKFVDKGGHTPSMNLDSLQWAITGVELLVEREE